MDGQGRRQTAPSIRNSNNFPVKPDSNSQPLASSARHDFVLNEIRPECDESVKLWNHVNMRCLGGVHSERTAIELGVPILGIQVVHKSQYPLGRIFVASCRGTR